MKEKNANDFILNAIEFLSFVSNTLTGKWTPTAQLPYKLYAELNFQKNKQKNVAIAGEIPENGRPFSMLECIVN